MSFNCDFFRVSPLALFITKISRQIKPILLEEEEQFFHFRRGNCETSSSGFGIGSGIDSVQVRLRRRFALICSLNGTGVDQFPTDKMAKKLLHTLSRLETMFNSNVLKISEAMMFLEAPLRILRFDSSIVFSFTFSRGCVTYILNSFRLL